MSNTDQDIHIYADNLCNSVKNVYDHFCMQEVDERTELILKRAHHLVNHVLTIKNILREFSNAPSDDSYNAMLCYLGDVSKGMDGLPDMPFDLQGNVFNHLNDFAAIFITRYGRNSK